ncbi:PREDICTED: uncharacterized protein LOC107081225, partial [Cyprinodon variegatus]|uniref:uncharacterized protein LOC107081225 n=1 Tax=Cyprinodon variegatus TaxID=28743 RepID=UPI0007428D5C
MDFRVQATADVNRFQDKEKVLELLHSHGFQLTDLKQGRFRVDGSFQDLKAVKVRLEQLLESTPPSSSDPPTVSQYYSRNEGSGRPPDSSHASRSSRRGPASQEDRFSGPERDTITIDTDVFKYASKFRKQELDYLLNAVQDRIEIKEENTTIVCQVGSSRTAVNKLQNFLNDLQRSLRTQEVPLRDLSSKGKELLSKIKKNNNTLASVLVCEMNDRLHLIGPSKESYELKQSLQGEPVDQSDGRGRTGGRINRGRSSSTPARYQKSTEREAANGPSAGSFHPKDDGLDAAGAA